MKARFCYVSNSSSSSFILRESNGTKGLTGDDWREMIVDLFPGYEKECAECREMEEEYNLEKCRYPVFCAFDLRNESEEAVSELGSILDGWTATNCVIRNGRLLKRKRDVTDEWDRFIEKVCCIIEQEMLDEHGGSSANASIWCMRREDIRDEWQHVDVFWSDGSFNRFTIDEKYLKILEDKWDAMGLCDNLDVLRSKEARFVVHFSENDSSRIRGMEEDGGGWETESYTYDRLCEIFAKWLVEHGRVPSDFSWRSLVDDTLTVNMHEG